MKTNIFGLDTEGLAEALKPFKLPAYRTKQIAEWMYQKGAVHFSDMTNLPKKLREELEAAFDINRAKLVEQWDSSDGKTSKYLLEFNDGVAVETVLMRQPYGNSVCISTQAGCAMGCAFCASTVNGVARSLTRGEMLAEVLFIDDLLKKEDKKVDTMVLMGSGEPMMNYDEVMAFLHLMHEPYCKNFSYRNVALSTSGVVPGIYRLMEENLPITLSISLHAPNDAVRDKIMPVNKKWKIAEVVKAGKLYGEKTKRRVTYEYILIENVNDGEEHARELSHLLHGQLANVNLIPINPVTERALFRPSAERIQRFLDILTRQHISATIRKEMGTDIQAACGQLRNQYMKENDA